MNKPETCTNMYEMQSKFFDDADKLLAETSACLDSLCVDFAEDNPGSSKAAAIEKLTIVIRCIRKLKIGSTLCGFDNVTEVAFVLEYLFIKMIENKLPFTQSDFRRCLRIINILRLQPELIRLNMPNDHALANELQVLLNQELNRVSLQHLMVPN